MMCVLMFKSSHRPMGDYRPMGDSRFAFCLQNRGGGVYVGGGTVTISSCTIIGNSARYVHAHAQKFPSSHCPNGMPC
jgi:hypothetical protein